MANSKTPSVRSEHAPKVRDGLCRHIRCKGMLIHIDDDLTNQRS